MSGGNLIRKKAAAASYPELVQAEADGRKTPLSPARGEG